MIPPPIGELLENLFDKKRHPTGRPYTLKEVATGTGLSIQALSKIRRGQTSDMNLETARRIAAFFGQQPAYFFGPAPSPEPPPEQTDMNPRLRGVAARMAEAWEEIPEAKQEAFLSMVEIMTEMAKGDEPRTGRSRVNLTADDEQD